MKKLVLSLIAFGQLFSSAYAYNSGSKEITFGTTPGDFADLVRDGLTPELQKKGYKIRVIEFSDYVTPNIALAEGSLDLNIFQHKPYLDQFAKEKGLKLSTLAQVPTAPLGLYPGKLKNLNLVKAGSVVSVPNDPTNQARALLILADLKWIELAKNINPLTVSLSDAKPIKGIKIVQLEAAQLPRSRDDVDFAIINGNYATLSGLKLTDALVQEKSNLYVNWVVIKNADAQAAYIKDVNTALNSEGFKKYAKARFPGYKLPANW